MQIELTLPDHCPACGALVARRWVQIDFAFYPDHKESHRAEFVSYKCNNEARREAHGTNWGGGCNRAYASAVALRAKQDALGKALAGE